MKSIKCFIISLFFFLFSFSLAGLSLYVTVAGDDNNPGTSALPFRTIAKAKDIVREQIDAGIVENIVVYIGAGNYYLKAPLVFTSADSQKNGFTVTYRSLTPGDWPIITSGRKITGWMPASTANIFQVYTGSTDFNILYENDIRGTRKSSVSALVNPGDFYLSNNGDLYYRTRNTPIENQDILAPSAYSLIEIKGNSPQALISDFAFEGIVFSTTDYNSAFTARPENEKGLFTMENAGRISIQRCKILNAGNSAIVINKGGQYIMINESRIDGFGVNGISFNGLIESDAGYNHPLNSYVNRNNSITRNLVTAGGAAGMGGAGINLYQSGGNTVANNCITRGVGSGIKVHGMVNPANAKNNRVENNRISLIRADSVWSAGIYAARTGRSNVYYNNAVYSLYNYNSAYAISGVFLDENTDGSVLENNLVYSVRDIPGNARPLYFSAAEIKVTNNIIANNDPFYDVVYNNKEAKTGTISLEHNIFHTPGGYFFHYFLERNSTGLLTSAQNIIYHPGGSYYIEYPPNKLSFSAWNNSTGFDRDSLVENNPVFLEPGSGLFRVEAASPALAAGFQNINFFPLGLPAGYPFKYATDRIEAENYSFSKAAIQRDTNVQCPGADSYLSYESVFFPRNLNFFSIRLSTNGLKGVDLDTTLEIRGTVGAGVLLGSAVLKGTGGNKEYEIVTVPLNQTLAGTYPLYLVFRGNNANIIRVDWFEFSGTGESSEPAYQHPPTVQIFNPAPGSQVLMNQGVHIEAEAFDEGDDLRSMEIHINNSLIFQGTGKYITYDWSTSRTGSYLIKVEATDNQGLKGSSSVTVIVKTKLDPGPEVEFISPRDGDNLPGPLDINIEISAIDSTSPVRMVEFYINGMAMFFDDTAPYQHLWQNVQPGEYTIMVNAINQNGFCTYSYINIFVNHSKYILGRWTFDDNSGGIAKDSSGNEHHGNIINAYPATGINGSALDFTGEGAVLTAYPLLNGLEQFTLAGWIKPRSFSYRIGLWGQDGVVEFGFIKMETIQLWTEQGGILEISYPYKVNEWHHITAIGDGTSLKIYFDGQLAKSESRTIAFYGNSEGSFNIGGGGIFDPSGNGFDGLIDNVVVYSKAVSDAEVQWLARRGSNFPPTIKILSPVSGSQFNGPCNIKIMVNTADKDSGVKLVEFYANGELIGVSDKPPFDFEWIGVIPQNYELSARVVDNDNAEARDTVSISVVLPGDALLGYWNFNDNDNTIAYDQSVNNNHGKIINGTIDKGIVGTGLYLGGNGAVTTKSGLINNLYAFTLAGWIKPAKTGWRTGLWGQDGTVEFGFGDEETITLWTQGGMVTAGYPFPLNEWHHIAAVGSSSGLKIYFDGKFAAGSNQRIMNFGGTPWTFNMGGGGIFDSYGNYFTGMIDEVYAYRKALSGEEILALASVNSRDKPQIKITGLADGTTIYYPFIATITAEITNNDCGVNAVGFFIDRNLVLEDTEAPYAYIWNMEAEPAEKSFLITAKLSTDCGLWNEHSITVNVASTAELKQQYALENGADPEDKTDVPAAAGKIGKKQQTTVINYYPPLTGNKKRENANALISSAKDKNKKQSSRFFPSKDKLMVTSGAENKQPENTHNSGKTEKSGAGDFFYNSPWAKVLAENLTPQPDAIRTVRSGTRDNQKATVNGLDPESSFSANTDILKQGYLVVPPAVKKLSQAGMVFFMLMSLLGSMFLVLTRQAKKR